jgi:hypothetical protein
MLLWAHPSSRFLFLTAGGVKYRVTAAAIKVAPCFISVLLFFLVFVDH